MIKDIRLYNCFRLITHYIDLRKLAVDINQHHIIKILSTNLSKVK